MIFVPRDGGGWNRTRAKNCWRGGLYARLHEIQFGVEATAEAWFRD